MGKCSHCGREVPWDNGGLCAACRDAENAKNQAKKFVYTGPVKYVCPDCGKVISEEQFGRAETEYELTPRSDGFAYISQLCGNCSQKRAVHSVKKFGKFIKVLLIIAVIGGLVYGGSLLVNKIVLGTSKLPEKAYEAVLKKAEENELLIKNVDDGVAPGATIAGYIRDYFDKDDWTVTAYGLNTKAEVQKKTSLGNAEYYFKFDKNSEERLKNRSFALIDGNIIEKGKENICYKPTAQEYDGLLEKLSAYLPENICVLENFTSQSTLSVKDKYMIDILYGENFTLYMDWNKSSMYEKTEDGLISMSFFESGRGRTTISVPKISECRTVE